MAIGVGNAQSVFLSRHIHALSFPLSFLYTHNLSIPQLQSHFTLHNRQLPASHHTPLNHYNHKTNNTPLRKNSMPLRPLLKKGLIIRSNQTGTKANYEQALRLSVSGKVKCVVEVLKLDDLNLALDRLKRGEVLGKLVVELS